jgi:hypothetical protein
MVLYQICVFGADLKSNMAARVHNVFSSIDLFICLLREVITTIDWYLWWMKSILKWETLSN